MPIPVSSYLLPILLLIGSNLFMTVAWYGHLRFKEVPLAGGIMARWGSAVYSAAQLKTLQEVITLVVFAGFSVVYLHQSITWNHVVGFGFIAAGAFFVFRGPL